MTVDLHALFALSLPMSAHYLSYSAGAGWNRAHWQASS
jgi:hypothetical protein